VTKPLQIRGAASWWALRAKLRPTVEMGRDFWEGVASPLPPSRGIGNRCELPGGVWGRTPEAKRFCLILTVMGGLWWHVNHGCHRSTISTRSVSCFVVVFEVSDVWTLIVDNSNEWIVIAIKQKYDTTVSFNAITILRNCDCIVFLHIFCGILV